MVSGQPDHEVTAATPEVNDVMKTERPYYWPGNKGFCFCLGGEGIDGSWNDLPSPARPAWDCNARTRALAGCQAYTGEIRKAMMYRVRHTSVDLLFPGTGFSHQSISALWPLVERR